MARCLPGLRERAVFGFCRPDRDAVPPPGRRSTAIAPFIPRWRAAYRGYGSVRSLDFAGRTGTQPRLREDGLQQSHRLSPGGALLTGATGACGLWILQAGQGRSPASGKTACSNRTVYPPVARCLPGLRERVVFVFCSPDRDAAPPPGRRPAAIAPFIPRWRVAYRGYGSVRSLDFVARTGT
ncbi:Uncharacterised protein [Raoultella planticola]|nr:Uncharacterised protein [Raoultella planticola]